MIIAIPAKAAVSKPVRVIPLFGSSLVAVSGLRWVGVDLFPFFFVCDRSTLHWQKRLLCLNCVLVLRIEAEASLTAKLSKHAIICQSIQSILVACWNVYVECSLRFKLG